MKYSLILSVFLNELSLSSAIKIQQKWDTDVRSDFPWVRTAFESNLDDQIEAATAKYSEGRRGVYTSNAERAAMEEAERIRKENQFKEFKG